MLEVGGYTNTKQGLVDVYSAAFLRSGYTTMNSNPSRVTAFGDSVRISPEAMALFTQSYTTLHNTKTIPSDGAPFDFAPKQAQSMPLEGAKSTDVVDESAESAEEGESLAGGGAQRDTVERQIQTLRTELSNLMAQMQNAGEQADLQGQIASLQAQLMTLQSQL